MQKPHCVTDYRDKNYNKEDIYFYDFFRVAAIKKILSNLVHQNFDIMLKLIFDFNLYLCLRVA